MKQYVASSGISLNLEDRMKQVYVFFAEGFEEIEGLTVVDLLRRAGIPVQMAGIAGAEDVTGSHGIRVGMDTEIGKVSLEEAEMLVLPGGMPGTKYLGASREVTTLLKGAEKKGVRIGAICAAPSVLGDLHLLEGKRAVCYPGFEERLYGANVETEEAVTDGLITTSRGLGTAIPFALEIIRVLKGEEKAKEIGASVIYRQ
jgi:4-methyl-5(b-hydroxyethyl)-thiazole monophosphate biosynthesis